MTINVGNLFSLNERNPSLQINWKYGVMKSENGLTSHSLKIFLKNYNYSLELSNYSGVRIPVDVGIRLKM